MVGEEDGELIIRGEAGSLSPPRREIALAALRDTA
jgi:hypothetical protein